MTTTNNNQLVFGTLRVEVVTGKNGDFNVGKVILPFAEVETTDQWLENFEQGEYEGTFVINRIYIRSIPCRNGMVMNVLKAEIPDFNIIEANAGAAVEGISTTVVEPTDPLQEEQSNQLPSNLAPSVINNSAESTVTSSLPASADEKEIQFDQSEIQALFGPIYGPQCISLDDLPDSIKFDEDITTDRKRLRELTQVINVTKGGTHKFDPQSKTWNRVSTVSEQA